MIDEAISIVQEDMLRTYMRWKLVIEKKLVESCKNSTNMMSITLSS